MAETKIVYVGCDHAGVALKKNVLENLKKMFVDLTFEDLGTHDENSVDYPDYAKLIADKIREQGLGILICGTGIGMAIAANKISGIRAAVVSDTTSARLSREHNDCNVLCMGARIVGPEAATDICRVWLTSQFLGGRHQNRLEKIRNMETGAC